MENKRKINYCLVTGVLIVLTIGFYYSYTNIEYARHNGVYTISFIEKERVARNGWNVKSTLWYLNKKYEYEGLVDWEVFSFKDKPKRFFTKILPDKPGKGYWPVFVLEVPDSIQSAPQEGWTEAWMQEHFPQVVADVHDTR